MRQTTEFLEELRDQALSWFNGIANSRQEDSFYQLTQIMLLSQPPVLLIVVL